MFRSKKLIAIVICLVLVLAYCHHRKNEAAAPQGFPPVAVLMQKVTPAQWPQILQATGTVSAEQGVILRAQVAGNILKEYVPSSATVQANQLIYQIDPQGLAQVVAQNQAELTLKKAQLDELSTLYKKGYVSTNDYNVAQEGYNVAVTTLQEDQQKLAMTKVVAPFAGQLGVSLVHEVDYVSVNQALISLQNSNQLRVDFNIADVDSSKVKIGQKVTLVVSEYPQKQLTATVISVNTNVDPQSQSVLVRANLDKPDVSIIPGSFATVQLYVVNSSPVLAIPQTAVVYGDSGDAAFRVTHGIAHLVPIVIGQRYGDAIAVESGLAAGDVIVSEGKVKLMDGMPVAESK